MQELLLIGSEKLNNNRYVYLKFSALKYLKYRDQEDVENVSVNRKIIRPGYRPLLNAVYTFENYLENNEIINTERSINILDDVIEKCRKIVAASRIANLHLIKLEKEEKVNELKTALKILGDRAGIYLTSFEEAEDLSNSILKFSCYDFDQEFEENTILKYIRLVSNFLSKLGIKNQAICCKYSLEVITLSETKKEVLKELTKEALQTSEKKRGFYLQGKSKQMISVPHQISYKVLGSIEGYIDTTSKGESEFDFVDNKTVDRLQELKNVLEGVEHKNEI